MGGRKWGAQAERNEHKRQKQSKAVGRSKPPVQHHSYKTLDGLFDTPGARQLGERAVELAIKGGES